MKHRGSWAQAPGLKIRLALAGLLLALFLIDTSAISRAWYDLKVQAVIAEPLEATRVTIIDIDDRSLAAVGRWPWSRAELATLFALVALTEPELVAIDLFFPEVGGVEDQELVEVLNDPRFLLATALDFESDQRIGVLPAMTPTDGESGAVGSNASAAGWVGLFPDLAEILSPSRVGHVNITDDADGVVRTLPGTISADGMAIRNFPSQIVKTLSSAEIFEGREADLHPIPYVFDPRSVTAVSALDVLEGSAPLELLTGRILVVGSSAAGLSDRVLTPMGFAVPGVTLQAMVTEAWLSGQYWQDRASWSFGLTVLAGFLALAVIWVFPKLTSSRWLLALAGLSLVVLVGNGLDLYWNGRLWDPTVLVLVCIVSVTMLAYQLYALQKLAASRVRDMFQSYVPSGVLDTLLSGDVDRFNRGERAKVTILFADLVGFTRLAEQSDPEALTRTVRHVLNVLTEAILAHGGTVDKYMGDAVMAFWGAPLPNPQQETQAVACAMAMQSAMQELPYGLQIGIGINTGEATVGNMGSDFRHAYSVLGDSVNVAARLESQTRVLGASILLGEATAARCTQATESLGTISVKGKQECIEVFCLQRV